MKKRVAFAACSVLIVVAVGSTVFLSNAANGKYEDAQIQQYAEITSEFSDHGYISYEANGVLHIDRAEIDKIADTYAVFGSGLDWNDAKDVVLNREALYHAALNAGITISDETLDAELDRQAALVRGSINYDEDIVPFLDFAGETIEENLLKNKELIREGMAIGILHDEIRTIIPESLTQEEYDAAFEAGKQQAIDEYLNSVNVVIEYINVN
ncbi:hypothetical protein FACS1894202_12450 [Clostridia bacterium]|nr:hypothetical protein FACS1894202_12450 [Clostridia bacterium]